MGPTASFAQPVEASATQQQHWLDASRQSPGQISVVPSPAPPVPTASFAQPVEANATQQQHRLDASRHFSQKNFKPSIEPWSLADTESWSSPLLDSEALDSVRSTNSS